MSCLAHFKSKLNLFCVKIIESLYMFFHKMEWNSKKLKDCEHKGDGVESKLI
jgi:hypothetical protein